MNKKWLLAVILALVVPVVALCGCSGGTTTVGAVNLNGQQAGIWVSGEGKISVTPDIALLQFGIEAQRDTVAEAQTEANAAMNEVMTALLSSGVAEEDIQTRYYSIRQVTRWDDYKNEEVVTGYRVTNTVSAKIRNVEAVGTVIDTVAVAGGDLTRIDNISFSVDDPTTYYGALRTEAIADARAKAEQLAGLAGVSLGKPTYISEGIQLPSSSYPRYDYYLEGAAVPTAPAIETSISAGEMEITLNVQVAYAIVN
ncbi:MAG: SIMPL domain-containing protein [Dehalococcoidales bacterium]|nr:SIMPL domain-containing protein [Dehalococcoidales bacterium]